MTPETWTSILLVAVGALITLLSTLVVDVIRSRRERAIRLEDRATERRKAGVGYARTVLEALDELWADMNNARRLNGTAHGFVVETEYSRRVYRSFLLIPDPSIRQLVQNGIFALNNYELLYPMPGRNEVMIDEQLEILIIMRQNLASWIRGDEPDPAQLARLQARADYIDARMAGED
jgi:hypothetical protein